MLAMITTTADDGHLGSTEVPSIGEMPKPFIQEMFLCPPFLYCCPLNKTEGTSFSLMSCQHCQQSLCSPINTSPGISSLMTISI